MGVRTTTKSGIWSPSGDTCHQWGASDDCVNTSGSLMLFTPPTQPLPLPLPLGLLLTHPDLACEELCHLDPTQVGWRGWHICMNFLMYLDWLLAVWFLYKLFLSAREHPSGVYFFHMLNQLDIGLFAHKKVKEVTCISCAFEFEVPCELPSSLI